MGSVTRDLKADAGRHATAVRQALAEAEAAIGRHPEVVAELYGTGREAYLDGVDRGGGCDDASTLIALRYLLAMAIISAWYHVEGDPHGRNRTAQSAALAAGPIIDPEQAFRQLLEFEQLWRRSFRMKGIGRRSFAGRLALKLLALAGVVILVIKVLSG